MTCGCVRPEPPTPPSPIATHALPLYWQIVVDAPAAESHAPVALSSVTITVSPVVGPPGRAVTRGNRTFVVNIALSIVGAWLNTGPPQVPVSSVQIAAFSAQV